MTSALSVIKIEHLGYSLPTGNDKIDFIGRPVIVMFS